MPTPWDRTEYLLALYSSGTWGTFSAISWKLVPTVNRGMAAEYLELVDCLESSGRATEWGYLEKNVLRETLSPLRDRLQRTDCQATWQLSDLLGLELWLQAFFDATPPDGFSMYG